jgi:predicted metalloendopeptidase
MLDLLQTVFGSRTMDVSLLDGADSRQAFQSLVTTIHGYGLSPFFTVWVGEDEKNSSVNIFQASRQCE